MKTTVVLLIIFVSTGLAFALEGEADELQLPLNRYQGDGLKAAKESADLFHSHEFQGRIETEQQRLKDEVFSTYTAPWEAQRQETEPTLVEQSGKLAETEKVYLFFSSSVPDETMQNYMAALIRADDPGIVPVMRGWVPSREDNKSDVQYYSRILQRDPACNNTLRACSYHQAGINLEPSLFSKYAITRVPAVVFESDTVAYLLRGDSSLDYLLERINREAGSTSLTRLIQRIRGRN